MTRSNDGSGSTLPRDLAAGLVVFLVALPLCLGVALASNAPLFSGVLAGIVGGIVVGTLSGSHTSVSGPAAGLTAIVAAQIASLGSFQAFLLAVVLAGVLQIVLGVVRAGSIAAFFPSSVIKGLLAAIGVILILKQIPHVVGYDADPPGDLAFRQPNQENTLSALGALLENIHPGATVVGIASLGLLVLWGRIKRLKTSIVPGPLLVVLLGVGLGELFRHAGGRWLIEPSHLVQVPVAESPSMFLGFLQLPDFAQWSNPHVYTAALTVAVVASLETLLNLEAVDKLDPLQRTSPPNRELWAQGIGNVMAGLIGGLPMTSVIVRSSVNVTSGGRTKLAAIVHGALLLSSVALLPVWLNRIPLSCLAAILLVTGVKLASPSLVRQMWSAGKNQFVPFAVTVAAIVFSDLLVGVLLGLVAGLGFILHSNLRRPIRRFVEKHLGGDVLRIELANQVSFLNRAALRDVLYAVPHGGHVLLDAGSTDYIDPDVLDLIRDFRETTAPAHGIAVSLSGFHERYELHDYVQYVDYSTRETQSRLTAEDVLRILKDGHDRFRTGRRLTRDLARQGGATAAGQHPLAIVLACIDSRTPAELVFDLGVGDIFSVRIAGNTTSGKVLGSLEYGCAQAGAKLILVMGHTRCGAVTAAVERACGVAPEGGIHCEHLPRVLHDIEESIDAEACRGYAQLSQREREALVDAAARRNVLRTMERVLEQSAALRGLVEEKKIAIVGAMYDLETGNIEFLPDPGDDRDGRRPDAAMQQTMSRSRD